MTTEYYVIAELDKRKAGEINHSKWPKVVAYSFNSSKIYMSEGYGHGLMGGSISLSNFDEKKWENIFLETGSDWFLKCITDGSLKSLTKEQDFVNLLKSNGFMIKKISY